MDVLCDNTCNVSEMSEDEINDFIDSRVFLMKWQMNIKSRRDEQSLAVCQSLIAQLVVCSGAVVKSQCAVSCTATEEYSAWYLKRIVSTVFESVFTGLLSVSRPPLFPEEAETVM